MSGMGQLGARLLGIILASAYAFSASSATAQITPDRTLPNNSNVTINGNVFNITGGTQAGRNLFHSFQQFSVPTGGTASFNNGLDIQNIFSRVTGGEVSNIDGLIKASGTANLFFINPNGIVFGKNASLNVGGSFVASTANSLKFADGFEYSAIAPQTTPLLTISVPSGLQFGTNPGSIQVQGDGQGIRTTSNLIDTTTGLRVRPNQTLALVGGDISLEGATLKTAGGRIELGSVAGNGLVSLTPDNKGFSLGYGEVQNFGNIQLSKQAAVDASGEGGGNIQVWGRNVTLTDGSRIEASTLGSKPGGSLVVNAQDSVQLIGTSGLFAQVYEGATGAGGNLTINTHQLSVQDGAQVSNSTFGAGKGGDLTINDTGQLLVQGGAQVSASTFGMGNSGNLTVTANSIQLTGTSTDGASSGLFAQANSGTGDAGNLTINTHQLSVQGRAGVSADTNGAGKGGDVTINDTGQLLVQDGARVSASTSGAGNSGSLTVTADSIQLTGTSTNGVSSGLFARANSGSKGNAGDLTINTHQLSVQGGAQVDASTSGAGNSRSLTVTADSIQLTGISTDGLFPSGLFAQANSSSKGNGGNLTINTHQLSVQGGAQVDAGTFGPGNSGNLTVTADSIQLTGISTDGPFPSGLFTANSGSKGNGGNLTINTHQLAVQDGAEVSASTNGAGKGGDVTINDTGQLLVQGGAKVNASTSGAGNSGSLTVTADSIQLTGTSSDGQTLSGLFAQANSGSKGDAGNLTINTHQLSVQDGARVSASTSGAGKGGDLTINNTGQLLVQGGAQVSASTSGMGNSGNLNVTADSVQLTGTSTDGKFSSGLFAQADLSSKGDAGNFTINTHQLLVQGGAQVSAGTFGTGKGGSLTVTADSIQLMGTSTDGKFSSGLFAQANSGSKGDAGNLTINTHQLSVQGGAQVSADTVGTGKGGSLTVKADSIQLTGTSANGDPGGLFAQALSGSKGDARDLTINTGQLLVQGGAQVGASTFGAGNSGNLNVTADSIQLTGTSTDGKFSSGLFAQANSGSKGNAADLTINTHQLSVQDGARVSASTNGAGTGGSLNVTADSIQLTGTSTDGQTLSGLFAQANSGSTGNAGNLTINTGQLSVQGGARVSAGTFGTGKGGELSVNANSVQLLGTYVGIHGEEGSQLITSSHSSGAAGDLKINTGVLRAEGGGFVDTSTYSSGNGGNLIVNAYSVLLSGTTPTGGLSSGLFSPANEDATGKAGNLTINTHDLVVQNGARVGAYGSIGKGGDLFIKADSVKVSGTNPSRSIASDLSASNTNADAGNIDINTRVLLVDRGGKINTSTNGAGNGGNLFVNARSIRLNNGILNANTFSNKTEPNQQQATITIHSGDLILNRDSNITTNAKGSNVNGGNININTDVLAAVENSKISADSTDAGGGKVIINTQGLFLSPDSTITARGTTSQLNGTVQINIYDIDPSRGLVTLPLKVVDATRLIDQNFCAVTAGTGSSFIITGRGGLPSSPDSLLSSNIVWEDWQLTTVRHDHRPTTAKDFQLFTPKHATPEPIIAATGWVKNKKGEIELIANPPAVTPPGSKFNPPSCHS